MKLVFFDIECACVYKTTAKICAFGYVVCDEQFNIIEKEDILINPKGKFHLTDGRGDHGLVLPYEYSEFKNYPAFPKVYPRIKQLLEDEDSLVFGHATLNDVKYLDLETNRFRLPPFSFRFSDSQLEYMTSINDFSRQFGLEYITQNLNVEFTPHRAADDAYATMRVVEALCKKHDCSCAQLDDVLKIKKGRLRFHKIDRPDSAAYADYRRKVQKSKEERAKARAKFYKAVNSRHRATSQKLKGKTFMFSRELEYEVAVSVPLVEQIFSTGGRYSQKLSQSTFYVCTESDDSVRTANAREAQGIQIITPEKLKELIDG